MLVTQYRPPVFYDALPPSPHMGNLTPQGHYAQGSFSQNNYGIVPDRNDRIIQKIPDPAFHLPASQQHLHSQYHMQHECKQPQDYYVNPWNGKAGVFDHWNNYLTYESAGHNLRFEAAGNYYLYPSEYDNCISICMKNADGILMVNDLTVDQNNKVRMYDTDGNLLPEQYDDVAQLAQHRFAMSTPPNYQFVESIDSDLPRLLSSQKTINEDPQAFVTTPAGDLPGVLLVSFKFAPDNNPQDVQMVKRPFKFENGTVKDIMGNPVEHGLTGLIRALHQEKNAEYNAKHPQQPTVPGVDKIVPPHELKAALEALQPIGRDAQAFVVTQGRSPNTYVCHYKLQANVSGAKVQQESVEFRMINGKVIAGGKQYQSVQHLALTHAVQKHADVKARYESQQQFQSQLRGGYSSQQESTPTVAPNRRPMPKIPGK